MKLIKGWILLISIVSSSLESCYLFNLNTLTISQLHEKYQASEWSVSNVTQCYLDRIQYLNPYWNAIIKVNPSALMQASILDVLVPVDIDLMPLYGVPILITDNLATNDLMETSLGSPLLKYIIPHDEAKVIIQLRKAGAIILGKTNDAELSGYKYGLNQFGYSDEGGQIKDPNNINSKVSGGNLGTVAALVGNLGLVGITTTLNEVVLGPSSIPNKLFCFSPSSKLISNQGIVPNNKYDKLAVLANNLTDVIIIVNTLSSKFKFKLPTSLDLHLNPTLIPMFNPIGIIKNSYRNQYVHNIEPLLTPYRIMEYLKIPLKLVDFKVPFNLLQINHFGLLPIFKSSLASYLQSKVVNNYNQITYENLLHLNNNNNLLQPFSSDFQLMNNQELLAKKLFQHIRKKLLLQIKQLVSSNHLSVLVILNDNRYPLTIVPRLLKLPFITVPIHPVGLTLVGLNGTSHTLIHLAAILSQFIVHPYK